MNKSELISVMAEKSSLTKKDCEAALDAFTSAVGDALKGGDKIQLVGFGTFECQRHFKMSIFAEWDVVFYRAAYRCYTALYTTSLAGLKPVKP